MVSQAILLSTLENVEKALKRKAIKTPAVIIIGEVVHHHKRLQKFMESIPSEQVDPVGDLGFDIWKVDAFEA